MTILTRARAVWRALESFAEALEADPVEDLRRRVARLERQAASPGVTPGTPRSERIEADEA